MALPSSGPLTLANIQTEFGGSNPISLSEYYAGGAYVGAGTSGTYGAVPSSGTISIQNFYGTAAGTPAGQVVYAGSTFTWVAPPGVTSVSVVAVGGGAGGGGYCGSGGYNTIGCSGTSSYFISTGTLIACAGTPANGGSNGGSAKSGGGNGGNAYTGSSAVGGGGAGGYTGNGGASATAGSGGGGGGGAIAGGPNGWAVGGGGVGLLGLGSSGGVSGGGSGGACGQTATYGGGYGGAYGGGGGSNSVPCFGGAYGGGGGGLVYGNNISVTPGNSYTVRGGGGGGGGAGLGGGWPGGRGALGAVRIIWSGITPITRAFPSTNTGNL